MRNLIISLFLLLSGHAFSSSPFLNECTRLSEYATLKNIFNTSNCEEIEKKISIATSFSELVAPDNKVKKKEKDILTYPWTDDFPYQYGLAKELLKSSKFITSKFYFNEISSLKLFKTFKNIKHIAYTPDYFYYNGSLGLCKLLKEFPALSIITLHEQLLRNPIATKCLSDASIDGVIIRGKFKGKSKALTEIKVLGIEFFIGSLEDLSKYHHLRYLGISNSAKTLSGIEALYGLSWLTHLSLNISGKLDDFSKIQSLKNLTYLNLTCTDQESANLPYLTECKGKSNLKDVSFLKKLFWLKHLNLSFNKIENISSIKNLKYLESLKLRGNQIETVDLKNLNALKYLDLSGNRIYKHDAIELSPSIIFLNLSGNKLNSYISLNSLKRLNYLNISNNSVFHYEKDLILPSLKVLNINGNGGIPGIEGFRNTDWKQAYFVEEIYLFEALFHDFSINPKENFHNKCAVFPLIKENLILSSFPNLEYLSIKNNQISQIPDISNLKNLKYLNFQMNKINQFDSYRLPENLETIVLEDNHFKLFPNTSSLKNLKKVSLSDNDITDINSVDFHELGYNELNLANNLIEDISSLKNHFNVYDKAKDLQLLGNPVQKNQTSCPPSRDGDIVGSTCSEYVLKNKGLLKDSLKYANLDNFEEWHSKRKCSITSLVP
jgi:Leucine-rich repeat (LRR) protein